MGASSKLMASLSPASENAFAFRVSWASPTEFYYVSDGKIRKRSVNGGAAQTIEFNAMLQVQACARHS